MYTLTVKVGRREQVMATAENWAEAVKLARIYAEANYGSTVIIRPA